MENYRRHKKIRNPDLIYKGTERIKTNEGSFRSAFVRFVYVLLGVILIYLVFLSPAFEIRDVKVNGLKEIPVDKVQNLIKDEARGFLAKNIIFFNSEKAQLVAADSIKEIKTISIRKSYPSTLVISIEEKEPKLIWIAGGKKYLVDSDGRTYKEIDPKSEIKLPQVEDSQNLTVNLGNKVVTKYFVDFIEKMIEDLPRRAEVNIVTISVLDITSEIHIKTDKGWWIYFDIKTSMEDQIQRLIIALNEAKEAGNTIKEYINLTISNKIYYK